MRFGQFIFIVSFMNYNECTTFRFTSKENVTYATKNFRKMIFFLINEMGSLCFDLVIVMEIKLWQLLLTLQ